MGDDSARVADEEAESGGEPEWESESSDEGLFFLDPEGRVPFAGNMSFDFRGAPRALTEALACPEVLQQVVKDCQTVFSAKAKKLAYSTGETFWMQADAVPRTCLERLAMDIFEAHTSGARFNKTTSGAEWWTQVIEDSDDIGWHWDKDYGMEAQGINVHPCLATVTYLSANGGPTVILEKEGPMTCEEVRGVSGQATKAWVSRPALGKHVCFDGRYLHAAPAGLALPPPAARPDATPSSSSPLPTAASTAASSFPASGDGGTNKRDNDGELKSVPPPAAVNGESDSSSGKRVTFLVNVWLNHVPRMATPLPEATSAELRSSPLAARLKPDDFVPPTVIRVKGAGAATEAAVSGANGVNCERQVQATPQEAGRPHPAVSEQEPHELSDAKLTSAAIVERGEEEAAAAVDMKWEFGEVGDESKHHLRYEVLVPVPAVLLHGADLASKGEWKAGHATSSPANGDMADSRRYRSSGGESYCVEYPSCSRRPQVSRIGLGQEGVNGASSGDSSDSSSSDEEEEEGGESEASVESG